MTTRAVIPSSLCPGTLQMTTSSALCNGAVQSKLEVWAGLK